MKAHTLCFIALFSGSLQILHAQSGCISGNCENGIGTYQFDNGVYTGAFQDGKRTGYGSYHWTDGSYYVGNFEDGKLQGEGSYYPSDGSSPQIGYFDNNEFVQADASGDDEDSLDEWLSAWDASDSADAAAKEEAIKNAKQMDFCDLVHAVEQDFPGNLESFKGAKTEDFMSELQSWYSTIMLRGSPEAGITENASNGDNTFYNILYEGANFSDARTTYEHFVSLMNHCAPACCLSLVRDTMSYRSEEYTSYLTTWVTFMARSGYDADVYKQLVYEIEFSNSLLSDTWEVVFRVYHLGDLGNDD